VSAHTESFSYAFPRSSADEAKREHRSGEIRSSRDSSICQWRKTPFFTTPNRRCSKIQQRRPSMLFHRRWQLTETTEEKFWNISFFRSFFPSPSFLYVPRVLLIKLGSDRTVGLFISDGLTDGMTDKNMWKAFRCQKLDEGMRFNLKWSARVCCSSSPRRCWTKSHPYRRSGVNNYLSFMHFCCCCKVRSSVCV